MLIDEKTIYNKTCIYIYICVCVCVCVLYCIVLYCKIVQKELIRRLFCLMFFFTCFHEVDETCAEISSPPGPILLQSKSMSIPPTRESVLRLAGVSLNCAMFAWAPSHCHLAPLKTSPQNQGSPHAALNLLPVIICLKIS